MGLRLAEGVDVETIADRFNLGAVVDWQRVERLVRSGHLTRERTQLTLTVTGRLLLDHILGEIAAADVRALAVG